MNSRPAPANRIVVLAPGISAAAPGVLFLHETQTLVAADVHFAYEDVIGGALPAWSTAEITATLLQGVAQLGAREIVLLGDVIHSSRMSEGAAQMVRQSLASLREAATLTIVAGNHEGKTRGAQILGCSVESVERDGWLLLHGDRAPQPSDVLRVKGVIIGHLHPSIPLGSSVTAPAFLAGDRLIVLPALTPYSAGLNVFSNACARALEPFAAASRRGLHVVAASAASLYPLGSLAELSKSRAR